MKKKFLTSACAMFSFFLAEQGFSMDQTQRDRLAELEEKIATADLNDSEQDEYETLKQLECSVTNSASVELYQDLNGFDPASPAPAAGKGVQTLALLNAQLKNLNAVESSLKDLNTTALAQDLEKVLGILGKKDPKDFLPVIVPLFGGVELGTGLDGLRATFNQLASLQSAKDLATFMPLFAALTPDLFKSLEKGSDVAPLFAKLQESIQEWNKLNASFSKYTDFLQAVIALDKTKISAVAANQELFVKLQKMLAQFKNLLGAVDGKSGDALVEALWKFFGTLNAEDFSVGVSELKTALEQFNKVAAVVADWEDDSRTTSALELMKNFSELDAGHLVSDSKTKKYFETLQESLKQIYAVVKGVESVGGSKEDRIKKFAELFSSKKTDASKLSLGLSKVQEAVAFFQKLIEHWEEASKAANEKDLSVALQKIPGNEVFVDAAARDSWKKCMDVLKAYYELIAAVSTKHDDDAKAKELVAQLEKNKTIFGIDDKVLAELKGDDKKAETLKKITEAATFAAFLAQVSSLTYSKAAKISSDYLKFLTDAVTKGTADPFVKFVISTDDDVLRNVLGTGAVALKKELKALADSDSFKTILANRARIKNLLNAAVPTILDGLEKLSKVANYSSADLTEANLKFILQDAFAKQVYHLAQLAQTNALTDGTHLKPENINGAGLENYLKELLLALEAAKGDLAAPYEADGSLKASVKALANKIAAGLGDALEKDSKAVVALKDKTDIGDIHNNMPDGNAKTTLGKIKDAVGIKAYKEGLAKLKEALPSGDFIDVLDGLLDIATWESVADMTAGLTGFAFTSVKDGGLEDDDSKVGSSFLNKKLKKDLDDLLTFAEAATVKTMADASDECAEAENKSRDVMAYIGKVGQNDFINVLKDETHDPDHVASPFSNFVRFKKYYNENFITHTAAFLDLYSKSSLKATSIVESLVAFKGDFKAVDNLSGAQLKEYLLNDSAGVGDLDTNAQKLFDVEDLKLKADLTEQQCAQVIKFVADLAFTGANFKIENGSAYEVQAEQKVTELKQAKMLEAILYQTFLRLASIEGADA